MVNLVDTRLRHVVALVAVTGLALLIVLMSGAGLQAAPNIAEIPSVIGTVQVGTGNAGNGPEGVAIDTDRNQIFVANSRDNAVYVINGDTNQVVTITHSALLSPWGAGYNPNNGKVYVASNGRNSVVVINAATLAVEQEIGDSSINLPDQVTVDALRNLIYVTNSGGGMVTVINGLNNTIAARFISIISTPHTVAIDSARNRAYISNLFFHPVDGPDFIMVFSTLSFSEVNRRNALAGANGIAVRSVDGTIYIGQNSSDTGQWRVAVVNPTDLSFKVGFPGLLIAGRQPMGMTYSAGSDRVYVNGYSSNTVDVIDANTNTLLVTLPVGANPASGIAINPTTGRVYVANRGSGSVTIIQDRATGPTPTPTSAASPTPTATPLCQSDSFEPDNTAAQANMINTAGLPQSHNICPAADQDWLTINVPAAVELTMQTRNLTGGTDTVMYLYAPDGTTLLACNDDKGTADCLATPSGESKQGLSVDERASRIVYSFSKAGQYVLKVKDFDPLAYGSLRKYDVVVSGGAPFTHKLSLPVIIADF